MLLKRFSLALLAALPLVLLLAACGTDSEPTAEPVSKPPPTSAPVPTPKPTATPVPEPEEPTVKQYSSPPAMTIDPNKSYTATIELEKGGEIVIEMFAKEAPVTVNNFIFLARDGYYDQVTFHRVIADFMAQSGDPTGTGSGGPGYTIKDEFSPLRRHNSPGVLSMANVGRPNTGGGQWFITLVPTPHLDDAHTVFGKVVDGMDVVNGIKIRNPSTATTPGDVISSITIEEGG
jgi:cyclophilin family peptidyl-prolyl cis-trans isomerase